ncbi:MAG: hypothetical protein E5X58_14045 [Mesorhizobium sp.]|nr:MAG: hypothetical protein E5X58_14045 [Mesorhizobium sp.]
MAFHLDMIPHSSPLRILNLETGKIVPNRSVPGRFEAFFRREYVQGAAPHQPQPGMAPRSATLLMGFPHPRPSGLCLSGKLNDGQIF